MPDGKLATSVNRFADPDQAYSVLAEAHRGLGEQASAALNARLVLILANEVGDIDVLRAAVALAKDAQPTNDRGS